MKAVSERQRQPVVTSELYILRLYYKVIALPLIICHQGAYITLCNFNVTTSSSEMTLGTPNSKSIRDCASLKQHPFISAFEKEV